MPKAEGSLYALRPESGPAHEADAVEVLRDIATALHDFGLVVVHRDIKPQNILRYNNAWYLADFGIARYIEEATAHYTFASWRTKEWTAPERFIGERATIKSDVYSLGVVGYWLATGRLPFEGPDITEQHRDLAPPPMPHTTALLRALILEMLSKAPEARPTPVQILERLSAINQAPPSPAIAKLHKLSGRYAEERSRADAAIAAAAATQKRRQVLADSAIDIAAGWFELLAQQLNVPGVSKEEGPSTLRFSLNVADLIVEKPKKYERSAVDTLPFDVLCAASILVSAHIDAAPRKRMAGRSHSLWYCDAHAEGEYSWFETGFCSEGREVVGVTPYSQSPDNSAARRAFYPEMGTEYVAVPLTPISSSTVQQFLEKWIGWFVDAADDTLAFRADLPHGPSERTWR